MSYAQEAPTCPIQFAELPFLPRFFPQNSAKPYTQEAATCPTQFTEFVLTALGKEGLLCTQICREPKLGVPSTAAPPALHFAEIFCWLLGKSSIE